MAEDATPKLSPGPSAFGSELAPALIDATDGRLTDLRFFHTDWQQGGAATAFGSYRFDDGTTRQVLVKTPVGPVEHRFTTRLANRGAPTPGVAASGLELGAYDLAWLVIEKLPGEPISRDLTKDDLVDITDAAAHFYKAASDAMGPPAEPPTPVDWRRLIDKARRAVRDNPLPDEQRWKEALKKISKSLDALTARWRGRPINTWRHGDLHPGNAMRRPADSAWGEPGCILIDLANVAPGNWITDAIYLERVHWGRPERLFGLKPVKLIAKARKKIGLEVSGDHHELANVRRALMAACVPAFLGREGRPKHLAGALAALEKSLAAL